MSRVRVRLAVAQPRRMGNELCSVLPHNGFRWKSKRVGVLQMETRTGVTLRRQALETIEKSTKMLEIAAALLKQGNAAEARRLLNEARTQRTNSALLMAAANRQESHLKVPLIILN